MIPQQVGARRIKTMVIRVNRLKNKKKELFFIQLMVMKFTLTRGRWTNPCLVHDTSETHARIHTCVLLCVSSVCLHDRSMEWVGPCEGLLHGSLVHFHDMARGHPCTHHHHLFDLCMIPAPLPPKLHVCDWPPFIKLIYVVSLFSPVQISAPEQILELNS